jgi:ubiquitin carboxyl-terminal hydrolase 7
LNVRGNSSLDDSFKEYIGLKSSGSKNPSSATRPSNMLQDATKRGVIFEEFATVLNLHLKRTAFDVSSDSIVKLNDYFSFPEQFDAAPYLSDTANKGEPWVYVLTGVIVHNGDVHQGSYYAFLRPTANGPFYKFNDDKVIPATKKEAMDENFGEHTNSNQGSSTKRCANAYMLIYIRKSRPHAVFHDIKMADIPEHLGTVSPRWFQRP